jgi:hypothetical protein
MILARAVWLELLFCQFYVIIVVSTLSLRNKAHVATMFLKKINMIVGAEFSPDTN